MWQKIRELICKEAEMKRLPKADEDYEHISNVISENVESNHIIHINTLKNIFDHWGRGTKEPGTKTKSTISEFLGFNDWNELIENIDDVYRSVMEHNQPIHKKNVSVLGFNDKASEISALQKGREIIIKYSPDREIRIKVLGDSRYRVVSSLNSSLIKDDEITIKSFQLGMEFTAFDIRRYGRNSGNYIAANGHVITKVIICPE